MKVPQLVADWDNQTISLEILWVQMTTPDIMTITEENPNNSKCFWVLIFLFKPWVVLLGTSIRMVKIERFITYINTEVNLILPYFLS